MALNPVSKSFDPVSQAAIDAFLSNRAPNGVFKKAGKIKRVKAQSTGRKTRIRRDLREWLAKTRPE